ncbi:hypothetical protein [Coraliomargarita akajimensis]|uniref:Uncharacterized protein n=1 Tax=Coraliomargarita akajimensis (strain DSM 45221 / IAM 15411 / JCM 23193 / KCTC 12865 / 04OKA010-24) TaxID=583355 RepID=D5EPG9_CORAD|nr:hypothetical protein [Coraliomargarita akajimensis]ADE53706.1 hypothetical protein Caka_0682 [Coraliomargarita akajimensis DSM 45221]
MKQYRDLIIVCAGLCVMALLVYLVVRQNQPKELDLQLQDHTADRSEEHQFIADVLVDESEEAVSQIAQEEGLGEGQQNPQDVQALFARERPAPNQPAKTLGQVQISPEVQRSLVSSSGMRQAAYANANSAHNHQTVQSLLEDTSSERAAE